MEREIGRKKIDAVGDVGAPREYHQCVLRPLYRFQPEHDRFAFFLSASAERNGECKPVMKHLKH